MKILSFRIADGLFGIDITNVKEINRNVEYTSVPRAQDTIVGLFNMRGQIVTIFDLAKILGYPSKETEGKATCIILKAAADNPNQWGFLIDKSGDVLDIDDEICENPPANVDGQEYKYISKVARLDDDLLMIIEPGRIINS